MKWKAEQHPSMYYVLNTHHRRYDSDMILLMLSTTETSYLNGTAAYDESKTLIRYDQQNLKASKEFTLFLSILRAGQIFCRYGNFKIWPWEIMTKVTGKVNGQGYIYITNHPIYLHYFCFVQIGPCIFRTSAIYHLTLKFGDQGQCQMQGKISINLVAISVVIVAKTDSKYGINTCIGI